MRKNGTGNTSTYAKERQKEDSASPCTSIGGCWRSRRIPLLRAIERPGKHKGPPQQPYDPSITAIFVTFTSIDIHAANAGSDSGWHTITTGATVNLFTVLNASKVLGKASLPAGKYTELRFNVSAVIVTISGINVTFTIPNGSLKIPITGAGAQAYGALTVNVVLALSFSSSDPYYPKWTLRPLASERNNSILSLSCCVSSNS